MIDLKKKPNSKDPVVFLKFYKICKSFKPDIIHTWGSMQTFYSVPASKILKIPLVNSQITDAPPSFPKSLFFRFENRVNFKNSTIICSNSYAGLKAYGQADSKKAVVVYNGLDMKRFENLEEKKEIKKKYQINTPYSVVMTATFSKNKDWDRFYKVAEYVTSLRKDITFIGVGAPADKSIYDRMCALSQNNDLIRFPGRTSEVENLVNACDIGILFSTNIFFGEGISNSILEYMALGKTVIADNSGGTSEFVKNGYNGFFTTNLTAEQTGDLIIRLLDNLEIRRRIGANARKTIEENFTLDKMGKAFTTLYDKLL